MLRKFILNHTDKYLARWVIYLFDVSSVVIAYGLATFTRFNFDLVAAQNSQALPKVAFVVFFYALGFFVSRSYVGIIRHTSLKDAVSIVKGSAFALFCLVALSYVDQASAANSSLLYIPRSILLIHFLITLFILIGSRLVVKYFYEVLAHNRRANVQRVLIYGAGSSGLTTLHTLTQDRTKDFDIIGFVDDNPYKFGKAIGGVFVYNPRKVFTYNFVKKHRPDQIIISIQKSLTPRRKKDIVEMALEFGIQVKIVPPFENWIRGELSTKQIKPVRIEDLLEREPIVLDNVNITREIKDKVVLVTGAAGSIGSEITRQLVHYNPKKIVMLDQAESPLYELETEIRRSRPEVAHLLEVVIGDVSDRKRMQRLFSHFEPDVVYHAAAYKHVPLMENNPYEAVNVNIFGTKNVAELAVEHCVEKFVLVSTDKAVNPTNVMGATKRTAEIFTQSLMQSSGIKTQFIITRFGNVLGSNGSVIPLFKKQIENGGPITLTDKRITRYFMTIPEACNLVLEAGAMGKGGEIFVFDMGDSVKIYDLAKKMVKLSGLRLNQDIEIKEIGLRPGEKLFEELLALKENTKSTYHPKIMIAEVAEMPREKVLKLLQELDSCIENTTENLELVRCLKKLVPEFISNNSIFASLDMKKIVNE